MVSLAFNPDGKLVASAGVDLTVLWDLSRRQPLAELNAGQVDTLTGFTAGEGTSIVLLEQGPTASEADFDQREVATLNRMYLDGGFARTSNRGVNPMLSLAALAYQIAQQVNARLNQPSRR